MTGDKHLLAMRKSGRTPLGGCVWVKTDAPALKTAYAEISIDRSDYPALLDLRCLVGLTALVEGSDSKRVEQVARACQKHAKRVIASVTDSHFPHTVSSIQDTDGVMNWPK